MDITNMYIVGGILMLGIGGAIAFYHYKKRNLEQLFNQVYESSKQVPKKKRNSFLLLMFKESLSASKNKSNPNSLAGKLNNPKFLEVQLVQMSRILKDTSKVQNKTIKKSLHLLESYKAWEKDKMAKDKEAVKANA